MRFRSHLARTIGLALGNLLASSKRVYACGATYAERVVVNAAVDGVQVYGGLACPADDGASAWKYTGTSTVIAPTSPGVALTLSGLTTGAHLEDVEADAMDGVNPGDSSIAVFASGAGPSSFTRVTMKAGAGVTGASGIAGANYSGAQAGMGDSPTTGSSEGAASVTCTCSDSSTSTGGTGGSGSITSPTGGGGGAPAIMGASATAGAGGNDSVANGQCSTGNNGAASLGAAGGAGATSAGTLTALAAEAEAEPEVCRLRSATREPSRRRRTEPRRRRLQRPRRVVPRGAAGPPRDEWRDGNGAASDGANGGRGVGD